MKKEFEELYAECQGQCKTCLYEGGCDLEKEIKNEK